MATKKGGLGRGLDSLFSENATENESTVTIKINDIEPNKKQPRCDFDEEALNELADSISKHGLIQPIVVRPNFGGTYTIIAGERRWRACRIAGLDAVPVIIKDVDEKEVMELALIENLQRENLNAVEEALGYKYMMEKLEITQEEAAQKVGKSRPAVANALRLLNLPESVLNYVENRQISPGHARALLAFENEAQMLEICKLIVKNGLSVREIEKLAKQQKAEPKAKPVKKRDSFFNEVELALGKSTGRKIKVNEAKKTIEIEFFDKDDLKSIAMLLENYGK